MNEVLIIVCDFIRIEKRKQEDTVSKEQSTSVNPIQKRSKRSSPSPPPSTSGSSPVLGTSEAEKNAAMSAFYQSLLESSYAVDGTWFMKFVKITQFFLIVFFLSFRIVSNE